MDKIFGTIKVNADYDFDVTYGDIFYCNCPFCEVENIVSVEYLDSISVCEHFVIFEPQDRTFLFTANINDVELDEDETTEENDDFIFF